MAEEMKAGPSKAKAKKEPYVPPKIALDAITACVQVLEGLSLQDRGHVVARLNALYGQKSPSKGQKATKKKASRKPDRKSEWKVKWETSPEYQAWSDAKGTEISPEAFSVLQADAFRKRAELRNETGSSPVKQDKTGKEEKDSSSSSSSGGKSPSGKKQKGQKAKSPTVPSGPSAGLSGAGSNNL